MTTNQQSIVRRILDTLLRRERFRPGDTARLGDTVRLVENGQVIGTVIAVNGRVVRTQMYDRHRPVSLLMRQVEVSTSR